MQEGKCAMSGFSSTSTPENRVHKALEHNNGSSVLRIAYLTTLATIWCVLLTATTSLALAANFTGQRITIAVSTTTGGSYDFYARLVSRHLGRFLNGSPQTVVVNMPGAGGVIEANWLYNVAPKDGSAMAIIPMSTAFESLLGGAQAKYDARKFNWLASLNDYVGSAIVSSRTNISTAQDMIQREVIIGGAGAGSDITIWPNLLKALIGAKIKLVTGYVGTANVFLAMERGEVQGMIGQDWDGVKTSKGAWITQGKIHVLMQIGLTRSPELKDVPTVMDFAKDPIERQVLELFVARQKYARPFAAPPGLSPDVITVLRDAYSRMVEDAEFQADASTSKLPIVYTPGEKINTLAETIYASPPSLIERAINELATASK